MTSEELFDLLNEIQVNKCETRILEIKAAKNGCPILRSTRYPGKRRNYCIFWRFQGPAKKWLSIWD